MSYTITNNVMYVRDRMGELVPVSMIASSKTVQLIESLDSNNMVNLRNIDSGSYILHGEFKPYSGSDSTLTFGANLLVNILRDSSNSQVQVFYPNNNSVQYINITDTSYETTNVYLNDLINNTQYEEFVFTLEDGTTVTKKVLVVK